LAEYVRAGGVVIYGSADYTGDGIYDADTVSPMLRAIFDYAAITAKDKDAITITDRADIIYPIYDRINNSYLRDDPIVNGPFGNLANVTGGTAFGDFKYLGDENNGTTYVINLPPGSIQIASAWTPHTEQNMIPESGSYAWYHPDYNFFYIGDSVDTYAINDTTTFNAPAIYDYVGANATGRPGSKIYGQTAHYYGQQWTYNAVLEMNAVAWAMSRAASNGINPH
jgi:hypothetical protein